MTELKSTEYAGWKNCLLIRRNHLQLIVTLDVGPRVISLRLDDGPNLFKEFEHELGKTQGDEFMLFGGHRLWHAPEVIPRTYSPDFDPVAHDWDGESLTLTQVTEPGTGIQKEIELRFESGHCVRVRHRMTNHNAWAIELAPWSMSMMAAGGRAIIPQEDFRSHPEHLYPARTLTLWHFTRMNDPRVRWGDRFIELREDSAVEQKIKFGLLNKQGWSAYWNNGYLFVKTFACRAGARYADMGCNFETFTMPGFLELETLGPLTRLEPEQSVIHDELWYCWKCPGLPEGERELEQALMPFLEMLVVPGS